MARRVPALAARRRTRLGAHVWWDAVTSGAFFTPASIWFTLIVSVTVMAPLQHFSGPSDYPAVVIVGTLGWAILAAALVPVAIAERRMRRRLLRGLLVLSALTAAGTLRPLVNEGVYVLLYQGAPDLTGLPARISSNLVVWVVGLSIIAMTVRSIELTRGIRARLADATAALAEGSRRLARFDAENREALAPLISRLRRERDEMLAGEIDFTAVRDYAEKVRAASHRLEERANLDLRVVQPDAGEPPEPACRRSPLAMLHPAPHLLTGFVFMLGAAPYAHHVGGLFTAIAAILIGVPVTLGADVAVRALGRNKTPVERGGIIVAVWAAAGILMTVLASLLVAEDDPARFVPSVSLPLVAIVLAACTDAITRASDTARRLEAVLGMVARTLTAKTAHARHPLRHASHVLHGRVQGRCVLLAAAADEWQLSAEDIGTFRRETDAAFDAILSVLAETSAGEAQGLLGAHEDLAELVATWSAVLDVSSDISADAADALIDPAVSRNVATVVNEGFVNAVKHSEARSVWLSIGVEDDALLVRTWSIGILERGPVAKPQTRGIGALGVGARIFQRDDTVVLEVPVPLGVDRERPVGPLAGRHRRAWSIRRTERTARVR
jgi:anti-sigma regulatory factor (Ser/Thr protein kinase)